MEAVVIHVLAYTVWAILLCFAMVLLGVVIAGIIEKMVEDIL